MRHTARCLHRDDRGTSLMELVVGMVVMTVFMTIFTGAVVGMAKTTIAVEAVTNSASEVNNAFLRVDKLVTYASAITTSTRGDWVVEIDSVTNYGVSPEKHECTQLWVDRSRQRLFLRTWNPPDATHTAISGISGWTALANNINNNVDKDGLDDFPFKAAATPSDPTSARFQRLTITLDTGAPGASSPTTHSAMTFTAVNSGPTDAGQCRQDQAGGLRP